MNEDVSLKIEQLKILAAKKFNSSQMKLIEKAIDFAIKKHDKQLRKSGEPFIIHPLSVALTLVQWDMDHETIIAGLLHDVIEDTETSEDEINNLFGKEILFLIKAVTKISIYSSKNRSQNEYGHNNQEYLIQMFVNMSHDLRVLFIKIADRYHNMQTIKYLNPESQKRIALETQEIYANLAGRLGMYKIKNEMLDMCFNVLEHDKYVEIENYINTSINKNKNLFDEIINKIKKKLNDLNILYECNDRIKGIYSTYLKLLNVGDVYDLFAIRIIVKNTLDCYLVLGAIHSLFVHIKNSFKDFISSPKSNLYQSLHTLIFYKGLNVEIQIRTNEMDEIANYGLASHWKYKEKYSNPLNEEIRNIFYKLTANDQNPFSLKSVDERLNVIKKIAKQKYNNIYNINTKKWNNISENMNAFEYAVFINKNKIGYLKEIIVNGKSIDLLSTFDSGDVVELIYDNKKTINTSWKLFTNDESIKKIIQTELENININIENNVNDFIKNINLNCNSNYSKKDIEDFIKKEFNICDIKDFITDLKIIKLNKNDLYNLFKDDKEIKDKVIKKIKEKSWKFIWNNSFFKSNNETFVKEIKITKCCTKLPYENVIGILTSDDVLEVHKHDCPCYDKCSKKIILSWNKDKIKKADRSFRAHVVLNGYFSFNNFNNTSNNIISCIQKYHGIIAQYYFNKEKIDKTFECDIELYVKNYSNLYKIMNELLSKSIINDWKLI